MGDHGKKQGDNCLKKSNILVYHQPSGTRVDRKVDDCKGKIPIKLCTPKPKTIKICTGKELRKMCAPKVCACDPPKKAKFGVLKALGFGLRSAIAAAVVYITYDMGIWGSPDDTQQFYTTACTIFKEPTPKKNDKWDPPSCEAESEFFSKAPYKPYGHCDNPPLRAEDAYEKTKHLWNKGVTFVFSGLAHLPSYFSKNDQKSANGENNQHDVAKKEPECVAYAQLPEEEREKFTNNIYK